MKEHRKTLISLMNKAGYRHNLQNVFDDFCTVTAIALSNQADPHGICTTLETREKRETKYTDILQKYNKEEQQLFPAMVAELTLELEDRVQMGRYTDVLGEIFHELELHNKWKGQFFTPQSVCDMMGKMVTDFKAISRTVKTYGFTSINEPSCGSGAMLLGFANGCKDVGINPCQEILFSAQDIDERCIHMAYIQCALYGFPAIIQQMNTLTMKAYSEPWFTPVYVWDGWHYRRRYKCRVERQEKELLEMICG